MLYVPHRRLVLMHGSMEAMVVFTYFTMHSELVFAYILHKGFLEDECILHIYHLRC